MPPKIRTGYLNRTTTCKMGPPLPMDLPFKYRKSDAKPGVGVIAEGTAISQRYAFVRDMLDLLRRLLGAPPARFRETAAPRSGVRRDLALPLPSVRNLGRRAAGA